PAAGKCAHCGVTRDLQPGERHPHLLIDVPRVGAGAAKSLRNDVSGPQITGHESVLRQPSDAQTRPVPDRSFMRVQITADDLKERGLTCAVPADDTYALARLDAK